MLFRSGAVEQIAQDTTYNFTVRAISSDNKITDRAFSIDVTGPDVPTLNQGAGVLFGCLAGEVIEYQLTAEDLDPNSKLTYSIVSGSLPTGLKLTSSGRIVGIAGAESSQIGDDWTQWDYKNPIKLEGSYTSTFTVRVSDGTNSSTRTYSIQLNDKRGLRADSTYNLADTTAITVDNQDRKSTRLNSSH